jgi:hypothetical protein
MKFFQLEDGLVTNYEEALVYSFAFLKSGKLYKPEVTLFNKVGIQATFGGPDKETPSWKEFYNALKENKSGPVVCVAGCNKADEERITLTFIPENANGTTTDKRNQLIFSISETVANSKVNSLLNDIQLLYNKLKDECSFD